MRRLFILGAATAVACWAAEFTPEAGAEWARVIGHWGYLATFRAATPMGDGGCVLVGSVPSFAGYRDDGLVVRLGTDGATEWQRMVGSPKDDAFNDVCGTSDGGFMAIGRTRPEGTSYYAAWCVKFAADGSVRWEKVFGLAGKYITGLQIREWSGGGYVAVCEPNLVLNLDETGALNWVKEIDDVWFPTSSTDVAGTPDGDCLIIYDAGVRELLRIGPNGEPRWAKAYVLPSSSLYAQLSGVSATSDGDILVSGADHGAGILARLDKEGGVCWSYRYEGEGSHTGLTVVFEDPSGTIVAAGSEPTVLTVDAAGSVRWQYKYDFRRSGRRLRPTHLDVAWLPGGGIFAAYAWQEWEGRHELAFGAVAAYLGSNGIISGCESLITKVDTTRSEFGMSSRTVSRSITSPSIKLWPVASRVLKAGLLNEGLCRTSGENE